MGHLDERLVEQILIKIQDKTEGYEYEVDIADYVGGKAGLKVATIYNAASLTLDLKRAVPLLCPKGDDDKAQFGLV